MSMRRRSSCYTLASGIALFAMLTVSGCSKDTNSPGGGGGGGATSTTFVGTMAGPTIGGKLTVVVPTGTPAPAAGQWAARAVISATGTFTPTGAAAIALTGTYDVSTKALSVTGGGFTFSGNYYSGVLRGSWVRSPSAASGSFILVFANSSTSVRAYCGTFTSTSGGSSGIFNFVIQGTAVDGVAYTSSGTEIPLQGTLGGTQITLINPQNPGPFLATGTLNTSTNTVSGTYNDSAGNSGTWSGAGC